MQEDSYSQRHGFNGYVLSRSVNNVGCRGFRSNMAQYIHMRIIMMRKAHVIHVPLICLIADICVCSLGIGRGLGDVTPINLALRALVKKTMDWT